MLIENIRRALAAILLICSFVGICVAGPVGVYLALAAALAGLIFAFDREALKCAWRNWGVRGFVLSFFILWLSFLPSAGDGDDVLAFVDFLAFPVILPAFALLFRQRSGDPVIQVSVLAAIGCFVALIYGYYEVSIVGNARATGNTSPIFFSAMAVILAFFSLLGLLTAKPKWSWLLLLGNLAGLGAAVLGGSRGAVLGYGSLLTVFSIYAIFFWPRSWPTKLATVGLVVLSNCSLAVIVAESSRVGSIVEIAANAVEGGPLTDRNTNQRFIIYGAAIRSILDSPVYGHGWWHRFEAAVPYMGQLGLDTIAHDNHAHLHNDALNFGSAGGAIAVFGYLVLLAAPIMGAWRSPADRYRGIRVTGAIGLVAAYFLMGSVDTMFVFEIPKSMYVLAAAVLLAYFQEKANKTAV